MAGARAQAQVALNPACLMWFALAVPPRAATFAALAGQAGEFTFRHHMPQTATQQADNVHVSPPWPENAGLPSVVTAPVHEGLVEMH